MEGDMTSFPHEWLKKQLGGSYEVPSSLSAEAIDILQKLRNINIESDSDADVLIMCLEKVRADIKSEDEKIKNILRKLQISVSDLEEKAQEQLMQAVNYQMKYNLKDLNRTTVLLDKVDRLQKKAKIDSLRTKLEIQNKRVIFMTDQLKKTSDELKRKNERAEENLNSLLKEAALKRLETEEMDLEIEKCTIELRDLKFQLQLLNVPDHEGHKELTDKITEVDKIKSEILEIQNDLKKYKGIPPDIFEAKKKLVEKYDKLREVEKEILSRLVGKN